MPRRPPTDAQKAGLGEASNAGKHPRGWREGAAGYIVGRGVFCPKCTRKLVLKSAISSQAPVPLYPENINPYNQKCHGCGDRVHLGYQGWPQLYDNPEKPGRPTGTGFLDKTEDTVPAVAEALITKRLQRLKKLAGASSQSGGYYDNSVNPGQGVAHESHELPKETLDKIRASLPMAMVQQTLHKHGWRPSRETLGNREVEFFHGDANHTAVGYHKITARHEGDWLFSKYARGGWKSIKMGKGHWPLHDFLTKFHGGKLGSLRPSMKPYTMEAADQELAAKIRKALPMALVHQVLGKHGFEQTYTPGEIGMGSQEHPGYSWWHKYPHTITVYHDGSWELSTWKLGNQVLAKFGRTRGKGHEALRQPLGGLRKAEDIIEAGGGWRLLLEAAWWSKEALERGLKKLDTHTAVRWAKLVGGYEPLVDTVNRMAKGYGIEVPTAALDTIQLASKGKAVQAHRVRYYRQTTETVRPHLSRVERMQRVLAHHGWKRYNDVIHVHPDLPGHKIGVFKDPGSPGIWIHSSPNGSGQKPVRSTGRSVNHLKHYVRTLHSVQGDFSKLAVEGKKFLQFEANGFTMAGTVPPVGFLSEGFWKRLKTSLAPTPPEDRVDPDAIMHRQELIRKGRAQGAAVREIWAKQHGYRTLDSVTSREVKTGSHPHGMVFYSQDPRKTFAGGSGVGAGTRVQFVAPPESKIHLKDLETWRRLRSDVHWITNAGPRMIQLRNLAGTRSVGLDRLVWGSAHVKIHPGTGGGSGSGVGVLQKDIPQTRRRMPLKHRKALDAYRKEKGLPPLEGLLA